MTSAGRDTLGVRVPERSAELLRDLVHGHTGMFYDESRLSFMLDRLSARAVERGFDSLLDYYYLLKYDPQAEEEWARAIDALSVQETYFWRESDQLRALTEAILPGLVAAGRRPVRIWSFPCATGEEPLSIAMALTEAGWFERASIELHASDASEAALKKAATRLYGGRSFRQLSVPLRDRYFDPVAGTAIVAGEIGDLRPCPVVDAGERRPRARGGVSRRRRRHFLPQPVHLLRPADRAARRRSLRGPHAVAWFPVRRRGGVAAAPDDSFRTARSVWGLCLRKAVRERVDVTSLVRVLVVDDSAYVRKVVTQMLTRSPFIEVVGTARDGREALELAVEKRPDVITCDLNMPEMDGVAFVREQMAPQPDPDRHHQRRQSVRRSGARRARSGRD